MIPETFILDSAGAERKCSAIIVGGGGGGGYRLHP